MLSNNQSIKSLLARVCLAMLVVGALGPAVAYAEETPSEDGTTQQQVTTVIPEPQDGAESLDDSVTHVPADQGEIGPDQLAEPVKAEDPSDETGSQNAGATQGQAANTQEELADESSSEQSATPSASTEDVQPGSGAELAAADATPTTETTLDGQGTEEISLDTHEGEKLAATSKEVDLSTYDASKLFASGKVYTISRSSGSDVVMAGGASPALAAATETLDGYWKIKNLGGGRYELVNMKSGALLSYTQDAGQVTTGTSGVWLLLKRLNGTYSLVPEGFEYLRLQALGKSAGAGMALRAASTSDAQGFCFTLASQLSKIVAKGVAVDAGIYAIKCDVGKKQVVQVSKSSKKSGANVLTSASKGAANQRWKIISAGNNLYVLKAVHSGKVLAIQGDTVKKGANVCQAKNAGKLSQLWYLVKDGSKYRIRNAKSGLGLSVYGGIAKSGTNIQVSKANKKVAQTYTLARDVALERSINAGRPLVDGIYRIGVASADGIVLDVEGSSTEKKANVALGKKADSFSQKVELTYIGHGLYTVQFAHSGLYLHVSSKGKAAGDNVMQYKRLKNSRKQKWYFVKTTKGYQICSGVTGLALDVAGAKENAGANVDIAAASASDKGQNFKVEMVPLLKDGTYAFSSVLSPAQLVSVKKASKKKSANVLISRMQRNADSQLWTIAYLGDGKYSLVNKNSGLALTVKKGNTDNGANVTQNGYAQKEWQKWVLGISDTGGITIKNSHSGKYIDLADGKSTAGTNIRQWNRIEAKRQSFLAYSTDSSFVKKGKTGYQNPTGYYQISAYACVLPSYAKGFYTYVSAPVLSPTATRKECVEAFIKRAYQYLGTRYMWDWSMAPGQGVDCSGLVMQCLYACGIQTPYNTYDHMFDPWQDHNAENMRADKKFKQISFSKRKRGDLIFYRGHVGIYIGNDMIINAVESGVQIQSVYSWAITGCSRVFI